MREISIVSGKGGTGKTSVTAAFAKLAERHLICDLDVDAADLHLLLAPEVLESHEFRAGRLAVIDPERCIGCGTCVPRCRFEALQPADGGTVRVIDSRCEGCLVCRHVCPAEAVTLVERVCGRWFQSRTAEAPMIHAQLVPGGENSGLLVSRLRREAWMTAAATGLELILSDGPPGVGCPVVSAIGGTTLVVIVTEPTPSGRADLERIADLARHFNRPAAVILNKADLDPAGAAAIAAVCAERGLPLVGQLPFSPAVVEALASGRTLLAVDADGVGNAIRAAWAQVAALTASLPDS